MPLHALTQRIIASPSSICLTNWCQEAKPTERIYLKGTPGSLPAFLMHPLIDEASPLALCVLERAEDAAYLYSDLQQINGRPDGIALFPATGEKPYDTEQMLGPATLIQRADLLHQIMAGFSGLVVTSVAALIENVPSPEATRNETLTIAIGQSIAPTTLVEQLAEHGFDRVEFVEQPGEMTLRGGLVDVFPFSGDYPIRIEFFGDEVDSIREFEVDSQRSVSRLTATRIVPNLEQTATSFSALFDYLPADTVIATFDEAHLLEACEVHFKQIEKVYEALPEEQQAGARAPEERYLHRNDFARGLGAHRQLCFGTFPGGANGATLPFDGRPQPDLNGNLALLRKRLDNNLAESMQTVILCDSGGQERRLRELLENEIAADKVSLQIDSLHQGFELPALGLAVYTDHQIFNRYHRPTARKQKKRLGGISLRELRNLTPGDFVVHVDYGIGKFAGLEHIKVRGKRQEAVRLLFRENDVLFVNVNALYKLHKYTGKEGHQPRLTKLGSGQWERTKARTKRRVKDIARDLIRLYARRKASAGSAFSPDSVWQRELEASFQFEDTPDQGSAAEAVKRDMEEAVPMDRLVCGDVGFGKTEVAVRAAFKAVQDGRQVAILVPTTILATQHFHTFQKRLAPFPVNIDVLSRFRSNKDQKVVLERLKKGEIDILIGTHRLISKDVVFKDMGLLVVDEEQRFGVSVKERLRQMRAEVDTLTLTATPIPRTLQFSLLGARDLSIIATAPPNRQPIITEIHTFDKDTIRDAILHETSRGGQVFFIHNRVQSIEEVTEMLRALLPDIRMRFAHGQMKGAELERVMAAFIDHKFDVLVSTNIIENGLDISNANTILINHANRFGLAELHQLRGRVGRADRKAFCYLLVPSIHGLTREARQRLQAIEEFSDLGSGFNIAMRDLDIRGAGSLLGAEQSGFIEDVGYETYHKILDETVQELRSDEFSHVFDTPALPPPADTTIDVEEDAFIPADYLSNNVERLNLYRRISEAPDEETLAAIREEMEDRFGAIPDEVGNLLLALHIKHLAERLRLPKVVFKNQRLFLEIPSLEKDPYFFDRLFHPLLERLGGLENRYVLKESKSKKLRAIVQSVPDLAAAERVMQHLMLETTAASGTPSAPFLARKSVS